MCRLEGGEVVEVFVERIRAVDVEAEVVEGGPSAVEVASACRSCRPAASCSCSCCCCSCSDPLIKRLPIKNATFLLTPISESPRAALRTAQPPGVDESWRTAEALCLSREERAYTAFARVLGEMGEEEGWRKVRRAGIGFSLRY